MSGSGSSSLKWDAERLRIATDAAGVALWSWNVDTNELDMDDRGHALWDVPRDGHLTFEKLALHIYPPDQPRVKTVIEATRTKPGPYQVDFRILHGDQISWIAARGLGADEGIVERIMFGIFMDVTERKQAEEGRELLAGEMSHRVKNLFAIASALTAIAARSAATTVEMARDLTQRLTALGQAHNLIRPSGEEKQQAALLSDLFTALLAPYDDKGQVGDRIHVSGPQVHVGEASATTLALVVHELATNSVKYGALSAAAGTLDVTCTVHNEKVVVVWTERGGPPVKALQGPPGFGSKLIAQSVTGQLGGSITYDCPPEGISITLRMREDRLAR